MSSTSPLSGQGDGVEVVTDAMRAFSRTSAGMAVDVMTTAGTEAVNSQAALLPAFGPIGAEFLAAYHQAERSHLDGAGRVALAHAGMAEGTAAGAAAYDARDDAAAAAAEGIRGEI